MSQDFELKFEKYKENNPTEATKDQENYPAASYTRSLGLAWPEGKMMFFNYNYLVSGEYIASDSMITLIFTTHTVMIKGIRLENLFFDLMSHIPKFITSSEKRYNEVADESKPMVNEINVTENN